MATVDTVTTVTHALRTLPYLAVADEAQVRRVARACAWRTIGKGGQLFRESEDADGLFVLVEGRVKLVRLSRSGREQVLHVEGPGASLGEVPVLDGAGYVATAVALTRVRALFVPRTALMRLYHENPDIAIGMATVIARRLRAFSALVGALSLQSASARLASLLLERQQSTGDRLVDIGSRDELAARLGTVREVVSRSLTTFVNAGVITRAGRSVRIVDANRLRAMAE